MLLENNRAFKEWAIACDALRDGRQIALIRKGGIREEGGIFTMSDHEFFLLPTFEHQKSELVRQEHLGELASRREPLNPASIEIDTYAVVDTIITAGDEDIVRAVAEETIWNSEYVKLRFDFNPYDPLYIVILRAYRLLNPVTVPLLPEYVGCRSWVTLDRQLCTTGAIAALPDTEFADRRDRLMSTAKS